MKVRVTKVMAKHIAKVLKENGIKVEEVSVVKTSERTYALLIGTSALAAADEYGDYDWENDTYKVIRVVYPYEYYATPRYLTTEELVRICREAHNNIDMFNQGICNAIAI